MTEFQKLIQLHLKTKTVAELAVLLKTSLPTIRRWANGLTTPHPLLAEAHAKTLSKELK